MEKISDNKKNLTELLQAFIEIQMPRSAYVLENLVVNTRFTDEQRYAQCVLELSIAYDNLRLAELGLEKLQIEIDEINTKGRKGEIEKEVKKIEMEQTKRACIGAMREFEALYNIWLKFPKKYTREELEKGQELEYKIRLETQAQQDIYAMGKISVGNQEGLRQVCKIMYPSLDVTKIYPELGLTKNVETKALNDGTTFNIKI